MCLVVSNTPGVSWWCPGHPETKVAAEFARVPPGGYGKTAKDKLAKKDQCFLSETAPSYHLLLDADLKKAYNSRKKSTKRKRKTDTNTDWHANTCLHIHNVKRIVNFKKMNLLSLFITSENVSLVSRFEKQIHLRCCQQNFSLRREHVTYLNFRINSKYCIFLNT